MSVRDLHRLECFADRAGCHWEITGCDSIFGSTTTGLSRGGFGSTQAATAGGVGTKETPRNGRGGTPDSALRRDRRWRIQYRLPGPQVSGGASRPQHGAVGGRTGTAPDSRNNLTYYGNSDGKRPRGATVLHPNQTGTTTVGAVSVAWRDVVITRFGARSHVEIDGLPIGQHRHDSLNLSTNIFPGYFDTLRQPFPTTISPP